MKKLKLILIACLITFSGSVHSQEFGEIFKAGPDDAELYLQNYMEPIMLSFNNGLGNGWYNTAKPHKLLGFDLTITANVANIPDDDKLWTFRNTDFQNLILVSGNDGSLPTVVGGPTNETLALSSTIVIDGTSYSNSGSPFPAPDGIDTDDLPLAGFPVPVVQLGIGLVKNTDLKIRYLPKVSTEDTEFSLWGVGVMHDLKQWIPGLKQVPFDLSGFIGYTALKAEFNIDETDSDPDYTFTGDGSVELKASSMTIQGVLSKKISILTPYVGVGYNIASSSLKVKGEYVYDDPNDAAPAQVFNDPISLDFDGGSSPRITAGLRIKLLILTIHADYTLQKYRTFTAGLGLSIR